MQNSKNLCSLVYLSGLIPMVLLEKKYLYSICYDSTCTKRKTLQGVQIWMSCRHCSIGRVTEVTARLQVSTSEENSHSFFFIFQLTKISSQGKMVMDSTMGDFWALGIH